MLGHGAKREAFCHMAVKAEQVHSGPSGATVWISVCQRACTVTSRALDVSRYKVLCVMFSRWRRGKVLVQQTGLQVAHKIVRILTRISLQTTFTPHWCSGVHQHACSHLRASMTAVTDHKVNTSLTDLSLGKNNVGDAGAAALADALQATVLTCKKCVFQGVCLMSLQMSLRKVVCRVGVVTLFCSVCCSFF